MAKGSAKSYATASILIGVIAVVGFLFFPVKLGLIFLPVLSIVGFILAVSIKGKSSTKTLAIVLNSIAILLCLLLYIAPLIGK